VSDDNITDDVLWLLDFTVSDDNVTGKVLWLSIYFTVSDGKIMNNAL
jgi:hypothetical protein